MLMDRSDRIKQLMMVRGISQDDLAALTGYSAGTISRIRAGSDFKTDQLAAICSILETTPNFILGYSSHSPEIESLINKLKAIDDLEIVVVIEKLISKIK